MCVGRSPGENFNDILYAMWKIIYILLLLLQYEIYFWSLQLLQSSDYVWTLDFIFEKCG